MPDNYAVNDNELHPASSRGNNSISSCSHRSTLIPKLYDVSNLEEGPQLIPKRRSHLGQQPSVHSSNQPGTFDFAPINTNIKLAIVPIERHIPCHFNGGINITSATSPSVPPPSTIISNEDDLTSLPSQSSFPNYRVSSNIDPYESDSTSHLSTSPTVQALSIGKVC